MRKLSLIISLLIVSILINGCAQKEPQIIYKKTPYYDFQKVDLKGAYIELEEQQQVCIPLLKELNIIYKETKNFYDEQINDYKRLNKESK